MHPDVMQGNSGLGRTVFMADHAFNGVKVFSATMAGDRLRLGEKVTAWMQSHTEFRIVEMRVTQSSDEAFHCLAITVFYWSTQD